MLFHTHYRSIGLNQIHLIVNLPQSDVRGELVLTNAGMIHEQTL